MELGKTAVIIGAARGIGQAMAIRLAVAAVDVNAEGASLAHRRKKEV